jgi:hypothetical protein
MTFDGNRVRIELCDVMSLTTGADPAIKTKQAAEVWISGEYKLRATGKPAVRLVGDSRPELLRQLAAWIEQHDDTGLARMAGEFAGIKREPKP